MTTQAADAERSRPSGSVAILASLESQMIQEELRRNHVCRTLLNVSAPSSSFSEHSSSPNASSDNIPLPSSADIKSVSPVALRVGQYTTLPDSPPLLPQTLVPGRVVSRINEEVWGLESNGIRERFKEMWKNGDSSDDGQWFEEDDDFEVLRWLLKVQGSDAVDESITEKSLGMKFKQAADASDFGEASISLDTKSHWWNMRSMSAESTPITPSISDSMYPYNERERRNAIVPSNSSASMSDTPTPAAVGSTFLQELDQFLQSESPDSDTPNFRHLGFGSLQLIGECGLMDSSEEAVREQHFGCVELNLADRGA